MMLSAEPALNHSTCSGLNVWSHSNATVLPSGLTISHCTVSPGTGGSGGTGPTGGTTGAPPKKQFYGTIDIDPVKAKMDFAQIHDEIVEQFTARVQALCELESRRCSSSTIG